MRGNPAIVAVAALVVGPIPACAGQPAARPVDNLQARAYPRVCGATSFANKYLPTYRGLSPRVRGNHRGHRKSCRCQGPIPACAGQPEPSSGAVAISRAYPRVCGATYASRSALKASYGLSPRVRGNQRRVGGGHWPVGPIPACAGQPQPSTHFCADLGAYPRVCGATGNALTAVRVSWGLSPRVRGNRFVEQAIARTQGPIPACAGQPTAAGQIAPVQGAYPRVCGATFSVFVSLAPF